MSGYDLITFLTDFGRSDIYVGVCHGVLAARAPHARVIDLTHDVPPQDVRTAAVLLADAVIHLPVAVHLAVVDPGVGTDRAGIAIVTDRGDALVGPDNGLLVPAAAALGGIAGVHALEDARFRLAEVSATFHGRDVFAPAAAALASGTDPTALGRALAAPVDLSLPAPAVAPGRLDVEVLTIDHFGNLQLAATPADAERAGLVVGGTVTLTVAAASHDLRYVRTFGDVPAGALGLHVDSTGRLSVAVTGGSAAARLAADVGTMVRLSLGDDQRA